MNFDKVNFSMLGFFIGAILMSTTLGLIGRSENVQTYNYAIDLMNQDKYSEASAVLTTLGEFKGADELLTICNNELGIVIEEDNTVGKYDNYRK